VDFTIRQATLDDVSQLRRLIADSARTLARGDYSSIQIEAALRGAWGVDTQLIRDGTYFIVEVGRSLAACGGWSRRRTLFGSDTQVGREPDLLDPRKDAARIRAFFVHPDFARQGIGSRLLERCEAAAQAEGFSSAELVATLPGERLYRRFGYEVMERREYELGEGNIRIEFVRMARCFRLGRVGLQ
jgi:GNAT superfamily N-acetyltransferase